MYHDDGQKKTKGLVLFVIQGHAQLEQLEQPSVRSYITSQTRFQAVYSNAVVRST